MNKPALGFLIACALSNLCCPAMASKLLDAEAVLAETDAQTLAAVAPAQSPAAALLADLKRFRTTAATLSPEQAASGWLELFDRAKALAEQAPGRDISSFDGDLQRPLGLPSVLASLPPPKSWAALRAQIEGREKKRPEGEKALALTLLGSVLNLDHEANANTLAALENRVVAMPQAERESARAPLLALRASLSTLYGSKTDIASNFELRVEEAGRNAYRFDVETPDLVGLLGEAKATELLTRALSKPVALKLTEGVATRELARRLALENVTTLRRAQWSLVDSVDAVTLYEALLRRFDAAAKDDDTAVGNPFESGRDEADAYYFLALVIAGRQAEAERSFARLNRNETFSMPRKAIEALQEAGQNEAFYRFLHAMLARRPELDAWKVYLEQAAYTGHQDEAIKLLETLSSRSDLPDYLRKNLQASQVDALLAADRTDPALEKIRDRLKAVPTADEKQLSDRLSAAIRLASLARVLETPEVAATAFRFATRAVELLLPKIDQDYAATVSITKLYAELRRQGSADQAQAVAIAVLKRPLGQADADFAAMTPNALRRSALVELAGIYAAAKQWEQVLKLIDGASAWGARDLKEVLSEKDSLGVTLGAMAARALSETGNTAAAAAVVDALLDALPGHDAGYALLLELAGKRAVAMLDERFTLDPFEERPLIWKAIALKSDGLLEQSEAAIRAAIAIDPSDGEQGRDDRMRAYGVLAELMDAKGERDAAATYRGAVKAIRLSEQADEMHALGLYRRAFVGYRSALEQFSDAYCIQSRLAVQLSKQGLHEQALIHYRRAYELMPDSFGRVESHCFGCESVFQDPAAQGIAEQVFDQLVKKTPNKPQAHYMLAYLRIEQGRYAEALDGLRMAVALDGDYLNAWKKLHELGEKTYIPAGERDIARLKLIELDPQQRHVRYELDKVGDLRGLWTAVDRAYAFTLARTGAASVYPLARSAAAFTDALAKMPESMREQAQQYLQLMDQAQAQKTSLNRPSIVLGKHALIAPIGQLLGGGSRYDFSD